MPKIIGALTTAIILLGLFFGVILPRLRLSNRSSPDVDSVVQATVQAYQSTINRAQLKVTTNGPAGDQCNFTTSGTGLKPGTQIAFDTGAAVGYDPGVVEADGTYTFSGSTTPEKGTLKATTSLGTAITIQYNVSC
jgi:hypothetical protein